ncbi:hypothetical protein QR680_002867 [Steinernema hermaphroditum]|uniref:Uncharacterized protein n=1 Tax=Steinernema hermaphroditum TaxID=289476 RepID=A0AA39LJ71_9BILA|nr:hypothetical protein QR680_002867 [Steinernema hermaphroditum]
MRRKPRISGQQHVRFITSLNPASCNDDARLIPLSKVITRRTKALFSQFQISSTKSYPRARRGKHKSCQLHKQRKTALTSSSLTSMSEHTSSDDDQLQRLA